MEFSLQTMERFPPHPFIFSKCTNIDAAPYIAITLLCLEKAALFRSNPLSYVSMQLYLLEDHKLPCCITMISFAQNILASQMSALAVDLTDYVLRSTMRKTEVLTSMYLYSWTTPCQSSLEPATIGITSRIPFILVSDSINSFILTSTQLCLSLACLNTFILCKKDLCSRCYEQ